MAVEIVMPRLSDTMEEGRIIKWLKQVGDPVAEGEPLLEVETDKADIEVEAFDTGVLLEITVEEGETVKVGEKIGSIGAEDEAPSAPAPAKEKAEEAEEEAEAREPEEEAGEEAEAEAREPEEEAGEKAEAEAREPEEEAGEKAEAEAREPEEEAEEEAEAEAREPEEEAEEEARPKEKVKEKAKEPEPEEKPEEEAEPVEPKKKAEKPKKEKTVAKEEPKEKPSRGEPAVSIHMETQEAIEKFVARRAPEKTPASPLARELAQKHGIDLSGIKGTGPGGEIVKRDVETAVARGKAPEKAKAGPPEKEEAKKATPLAAVLAEKEGVDLDEIAGTGIDGRIREIDVKAYVARRCALRGEEYRELSLMRKTIARRMTQSKQSIPHFYLTMAIDMDAAIEFRKKLNEGRGDDEKISVNDIIVKAAALALGEVPEVNSLFADDKIKVNDAVNIGNATTTPDGLVVPVIFDADEKSVAEIAAETKDKAERARKRKLRPDEYSNATFTVTNLGMFGIEQFSAIIDPGQSAILAVGAAIEEPVIVNGEVKAKKTMRVTLSCDHRVIDGYTGTQYLIKLKSILEEPDKTIT